MNLHDVVPLVDGSMLSCYTASIAEYMERSGIDHHIAIGTQLFLGIDTSNANELRLGFVHYHTPLRGDVSTHALPLRSVKATAIHSSIQRITDEIEQHRCVIIAGDAYYLPWAVNRGRRHVSHWFLLDGITDQGKKVHVVDALSFTSREGTQTPFVGWIDRASLAEVAYTDLPSNAIHESRRRFVFGDIGDIEYPPNPGYQWFEALTRPHAKPDIPEIALPLLSATCLYHSGQKERRDLSKPSWVSGVDAFEYLARFLEANLNNPVVYSIKDDLWVASRSRRLFATTLAKLAEELRNRSMMALAGWCEEEIIPKWTTLIQIIEFCEQRLQRGHAAASLPIALLHEIGNSERRLIERLDVAVSGGGHANLTAKYDRTTGSAPKAVQGDEFGGREGSGAFLQGGVAHPGIESTYCRRASLTAEDEQRIDVIWEEVTGSGIADVCDNFFTHGGDSLKAVQLLARLCDTYLVEIPMRAFLESPTKSTLMYLIDLVRWGGAPQRAEIDSSTDQREVIEL